MSAVEVIVSLERMRRSRVALLATRLEVVSTMLAMAENARDWPNAQRLEAIARDAYQKVARDFQQVRFAPGEIESFADKVTNLSKRLHIFSESAPLRAKIAARDARARLLASCWRIELDGDEDESESPLEQADPAERRWRELHAAIYSRRIH